MEDISIERYSSQIVKIYRSKDDSYYGDLYSEHEFNKFRIKMLLQKRTSDYYFVWKDYKITVDERGDMSDFPEVMYDQTRKDLLKILKITGR